MDKVRAELFRGELAIDDVVHQLEERVPEPILIQERHRLGMQAQPRPGQHLDRLFQRSDTAWQGHERIAFIKHHLLARVHVLDDAMVDLFVNTFLVQ